MFYSPALRATSWVLNRKDSAPPHIWSIPSVNLCGTSALQILCLFSCWASSSHKQTRRGEGCPNKPTLHLKKNCFHWWIYQMLCIFPGHTSPLTVVITQHSISVDMLQPDRPVCCYGDWFQTDSRQLKISVWVSYYWRTGVGSVPLCRIFSCTVYIHTSLFLILNQGKAWPWAFRWQTYISNSTTDICDCV